MWWLIAKLDGHKASNAGLQAIQREKKKMTRGKQVSEGSTKKSTKQKTFNSREDVSAFMTELEQIICAKHNRWLRRNVVENARHRIHIVWCLHTALCPRSVSPPQKKNKFDLTEKSENICLSLHVMWFNVHGCVHFYIASKSISTTLHLIL